MRGTDAAGNAAEQRGPRFRMQFRSNTVMVVAPDSNRILFYIYSVNNFSNRIFAAVFCFLYYSKPIGKVCQYIRRKYFADSKAESQPSVHIGRKENHRDQTAEQKSTNQKTNPPWTLRRAELCICLTKHEDQKSCCIQKILSLTKQKNVVCGLFSQQNYAIEKTHPKAAALRCVLLGKDTNFNTNAPP